MIEIIIFSFCDYGDTADDEDGDGDDENAVLQHVNKFTQWWWRQWWWRRWWWQRQWWRRRRWWCLRHPVKWASVSDYWVLLCAQVGITSDPGICWISQSDCGKALLFISSPEYLPKTFVYKAICTTKSATLVQRYSALQWVSCNPQRFQIICISQCMDCNAVSVSNMIEQFRDYSVDCPDHCPDIKK